jgi:hypothetical protein
MLLTELNYSEEDLGLIPKKVGHFKCAWKNILYLCCECDTIEP